MKKLLAIAVLLTIAQTASAQSHSAQFTWTASTSTGVTGYNVYRAPCTGTVTGTACSADGTFTKVNSTLIAGTAFTDGSSALTAGSKWDWYATAVCPTCSPTESDPGNHQAATMPLDGKPQPPTNFVLALLAKIWQFLRGIFA